jgi:hypothetical protein
MPDLVYYLTTHHPGWLWDPAADFPLFVSHRRLMTYRTLRPATHGWALDSGAYTELSLHGHWTIGAREYAGAVARYDRDIGRLEWAATQDWLCGPPVLARTGQTVEEHQQRTVANFLELQALWPEYSDSESPFMPPLQGWTLAQFERCAEIYLASGVQLEDYPIVGLGSIAARSDTPEVEAIVRTFTPSLALHGFGVKVKGLLRYGRRLTSADSLAWSYQARRLPPMPGHTAHINCANCLPYAAQWRRHLLAGHAAQADHLVQMTLDEAAVAAS